MAGRKWNPISAKNYMASVDNSEKAIRGLKYWSAYDYVKNFRNY